VVVFRTNVVVTVLLPDHVAMKPIVTAQPRDAEWYDALLDY